MAGSVNKVILIGNLGSDPEVRYLESGSAVAKFNIATTETYTNKNGERVDNTEWHRIELWEGLAKVAEKYLKKGNQVYIEGRIRTDTWTDKEGQQRTGVTIRANSMTLLGGPAGGGSSAGNSGGDYNQGGQQGGYQPSGNAPRANNGPRPSDPIPPSMASGNGDDDDLPF
ncbi:single-stranded DNA-binding protein [Dyadobacter endophyticus]|uniref:single-stranded DNA-binding protein n=1 Tax=Dyadobacter TaxID=120831 RepID=UPI003CF8267E